MSLWDPHSVLYSLMCLCVALKKDWNRKARCPHTTGDLLVTHRPSCETKHLGKIFLETFNQCHSSVMFTVEIESNCMLPFLGTQLLNRSSRRGDQSECQTTDIGLLLPYKSHVDVRYKRAFAKNYAWSVLSDFCWSVFLRRMRSS